MEIHASESFCQKNNIVSYRALFFFVVFLLGVLPTPVNAEKQQRKFVKNEIIYITALSCDTQEQVEDIFSTLVIYGRNVGRKKYLEYVQKINKEGLPSCSYSHFYAKVLEKVSLFLDVELADGVISDVYILKIQTSDGRELYTSASRDVIEYSKDDSI